MVRPSLQEFVPNGKAYKKPALTSRHPGYFALLENHSRILTASHGFRIQDSGSTSNLGGGALQRSTLRRKINSEEHGEVSDQFMRWIWAGDRKIKGFVRRRAVEAGLYEKISLKNETISMLRIE